MIRNLRCTVTIDSVVANSMTKNAFLFTVNAISLHDYPLALEAGSTPRPLVQKKTWRDSLPIDMLLSAVSILVVVQSSSEIPGGLMNNPVLEEPQSQSQCHYVHQNLTWDALRWNPGLHCKRELASHSTAFYRQRFVFDSFPVFARLSFWEERHVDEDDCGARRKDIDRGKPRGARRKTCLSATWSTTHLLWTVLGSKPRLRK